MKLGLKLAVYIAILALLSSGVVALNSFFSIQKRVEQTTVESASALVRTVYGTAVKAAYLGDEELAIEVIIGLQYNAEISCATMRAHDLIVGSNRECRNDVFIARKLVSPEASSFVGDLVIYISQSYKEALVREQLLHELKSLVAVILVVCFSLLLITYKLITEPIQNLSKQLSKVRFESDDVGLLEEGARKDELGNIGRVINLMLVNAKKQIISEQILARRAEEISTHFKLIFELSKNYLAVTDGELNLTSCNPKFKELITKTKEPDAIMHTDGWLRCISEQPDVLRKMILSSDEFNKPISTEIEFHYGNSERLFFNLTFVKNKAVDEDITVLIFVNDVTDQQLKLLESEYEASHDNLTKLTNRLAATRQIRHLLSAREYSNELAIIFIDLDGFKGINDELGHDAGDDVLRSVAERIRSVTRKSDIACRWGGDEFLLALVDVNVSEANEVAAKLLEAVVQPMHFRECDVTRTVGASIGVALSTEEVSDFATLFDQADRAMYRIKKSGKNAILVHAS